MRGAITRQYSVSCGKCGVVKILTEEHSLIVAANEVEKHGWRMLRTVGWTCPTCNPENHG